MVIPNLTIPIVIPMGNLPLELLWSFKADRDLSPPYTHQQLEVDIEEIKQDTQPEEDIEEHTKPEEAIT